MLTQKEAKSQGSDHFKALPFEQKHYKDFQILQETLCLKGSGEPDGKAMKDELKEEATKIPLYL